MTPAFLIAVLLWEPLQQAMAHQLVRGVSEHDAFAQAQEDVLRTQNDLLAVPKRFTLPAAEIWSLQSRLQRRRQPDRLLGHPRFGPLSIFWRCVRSTSRTCEPCLDFWAARQDGVELPTLQRERGETPDGSGPRRRRRRRGRRRGASERRPTDDRRRAMSTWPAFIGLGANLGDPAGQIERALDAIAGLPPDHAGDALGAVPEPAHGAGRSAGLRQRRGAGGHRAGAARSC